MKPDTKVHTTPLLLGLPKQTLVEARRRVALVSFAFGITGFGVMVLYGITMLLTDYRFFSANRVAFLGDAFLFMMCFVLWVVARAKRFSDKTVLNFALVCEVLCCLAISLGTYYYYDEKAGIFPFVTWVIPIIIMYPLIIPTRSRHAVIAACAAGATVPASLLLFRLGNLHREANGTDYFVAIFSVVLGVAIAIAGSRAVNRTALKAANVSNYELEGEKPVGTGGMGEVWKARHTLLDAPAAVKLIRADLLESLGRKRREVAIQRLDHEASRVARLQCPHTVNVYDSGVTVENRPFLVMEFLDGRPLEWFMDPGREPLERVVHVLMQVCESLAEAHARDLVHRDIKHSNILLCRYGRDVDFVKVIDFGIAKDLEVAPEGIQPAAAPLTEQKEILGSSNFIAPEQVTQKVVDGRADIYSLGCLAYHLITGKLPFNGETPMERMTRRLCDCHTPPRPATLVPDLPADLDDLIMSCMSIDPDRRPRTMDEVAGRLERSLNGRRWTQDRARALWAEKYPEPSTPVEVGA